MTVMPPSENAPTVQATMPTDDQIMEVMNLSVTSTKQLCDRLRDLFAGFDYFDGSQDWLRVLRYWSESEGSEPLNFRRASVPEKVQNLLKLAFQQRSLEEYQAEIREINEANGWFDDERSFGDDIALLHTEVSEMYEAYRDHLFADATEAHDSEYGLPKPEGVGSEAADVLVRLLDSCERHGINLRYELERKLAYNRTRGYKHGGKHV